MRNLILSMFLVLAACGSGSTGISPQDNDHEADEATVACVLVSESDWAATVVRVKMYLDDLILVYNRGFDPRLPSNIPFLLMNAPSGYRDPFIFMPGRYSVQWTEYRMPWTYVYRTSFEVTAGSNLITLVREEAEFISTTEPPPR